MFIFIKLLLLLLSLVTFSFILPETTCAQLPLHPGEAAVLRVIAKKLGAQLLNSTDPCQLGNLPLAIQHPGERQNNTIICNFTIGSFSHITNIELKALSLQGSLPWELVSLTYLQEIRISDNSFTGTVPEFVGGWINLEMLEMYSSGLEGPIPAAIFSLGSLNDLRITDMNGSKFPFPNLTSNRFQKFDLTFNKLEGEINGIRTTPQFMFLSGNMLSGNIPWHIKVS